MEFIECSDSITTKELMQQTLEYPKELIEEDANREETNKFITDSAKRKAAIQHRIATYLNLYNS